MGRTEVFALEVAIVFWAWSPVIPELFPVLAVSHEPMLHIYVLLVAFGCRFFAKNPRAVVLSVCIGVGGCLYPISPTLFLAGMAWRELMKRAHISASAVCFAVGQLPDTSMAASSFWRRDALVFPAGASSYWLMIAGVFVVAASLWYG